MDSRASSLCSVHALNRLSREDLSLLTGIFQPCLDTALISCSREPCLSRAVGLEDLLWSQCSYSGHNHPVTL